MDLNRLQSRDKRSLPPSQSLVISGSNADPDLSAKENNKIVILIDLIPTSFGRILRKISATTKNKPQVV
jgi:hypothetical protein